MGYWISMSLPESEEPLRVERFEEGGTYPIGGTEEAHLSVTYNYAPHYRRLIDKDQGIRWLYGKVGAEVAETLEHAIAQLGDDVHSNYWEPTEGNAKRPLVRLLSWARQHPEGVFSGD